MEVTEAAPVPPGWPLKWRNLAPQSLSGGHGAGSGPRVVASVPETMRESGLRAGSPALSPEQPHRPSMTMKPKVTRRLPPGHPVPPPQSSPPPKQPDPYPDARAHRSRGPICLTASLCSTGCPPVHFCACDCRPWVLRPCSRGSRACHSSPGQDRPGPLPQSACCASVNAAKAMSALEGW